MKYNINKINLSGRISELSDYTIYEISENIILLANTDSVNKYKKTEACFYIALEKCLASLNAFTADICNNNEILFLYVLENYNNKWFLTCAMYKDISKTGTELFRIINNTLSEILYNLCLLPQNKKHLDIIQTILTGIGQPSVKITVNPCQHQLQLEYNRINS